MTLRQIRKNANGSYVVRRKAGKPRPLIWASLAVFTAAGCGVGVWCGAEQGIGAGFSFCAIGSVMLGPLWLSLAREDASQIVLEVNDETLLVREKLALEKRILRADIELLCVTCPAHKGRRLPVYSVTARLLSTKTEAIVDGMTEAGSALWLAQTLASELNVEATTRTR